MPAIQPTTKEVTFSPDELIVSKTDTKGIIRYANHVFLNVAGYKESEVLNQPHNLIRHPDMPGCVFKLLWNTLKNGEEIFAYVKNMTKNGDFYWVFAHVTPSFDGSGAITGFHSNRRVACREALEKVIPLYRSLLNIESQFNNRKEGSEASLKQLEKILEDQNIRYDQWVFSLSPTTSLSNSLS